MTLDLWLPLSVKSLDSHEIDIPASGQDDKRENS